MLHESVKNVKDMNKNNTSIYWINHTSIELFQNLASVAYMFFITIKQLWW